MNGNERTIFVLKKEDELSGSNQLDMLLADQQFVGVVTILCENVEDLKKVEEILKMYPLKNYEDITIYNPYQPHRSEDEVISTFLKSLRTSVKSERKGLLLTLRELFEGLQSDHAIFINHPGGKIHKIGMKSSNSLSLLTVKQTALKDLDVWNIYKIKKKEQINERTIFVNMDDLFGSDQLNMLVADQQFDGVVTILCENVEDLKKVEEMLKMYPLKNYKDITLYNPYQPDHSEDEVISTFLKSLRTSVKSERKGLLLTLRELFEGLQSDHAIFINHPGRGIRKIGMKSSNHLSLLTEKRKKNAGLGSSGGQGNMSAAAEGNVLAKCHVVPANYLAGVGLDLDVQVRRQDTTVETVKLHQEYERFIKTEFPDFQKMYLQFPEVFAPKRKDAEKAIKGFLQKPGSDSAVWLTHAVCDKAESDVFYDVEKQFRNRTAVSYNGFQLGSVFKVAKETMKDDRNKRREQNNDILDVPLSNSEMDLYRLLGQDPTELTDCVDGIVKNLFGEDDCDEIDKNRLKDNIDLITTENKWVCKRLLGKIEHLFKTQNIQRNLSKQEIHSFVINKIFERNIKKNQELSELVVDKKSSTVIQVEIKSVQRFKGNFHDKGLSREFTKACEHIGQGKEMFLRVLAPNSNLSSDWGFQGLVCFPNVSDKQHFERLKLSPIELDKIITGHELKAGNWLNFIKSMNKESTDEEYMKILSIMIGSAYVDVNSQIYECKDEEKETPPAFQDLKGLPLGNVKSILFWTKEQHNLLEMRKNDKHVAIAGDIGVGKTSILVSFAMLEAEAEKVDTYYIPATSYDETVAYEEEVEYLLDIATKEKFSSSNVIVKSLSDVRQQNNQQPTTPYHLIMKQFMKQIGSDQKIFIDEFPLSKDDLQKMKDNEDSELSTTLQEIKNNSQMSWIAFCTGDLLEFKHGSDEKPRPDISQVKQYLQCKAGYELAQLGLTMRNSRNIKSASVDNPTEYSAAGNPNTPVKVLPAGLSHPSTVAGQRPYCLLSPWSSLVDYTRIGTSLKYAMKTILQIPQPVTEHLAILCSGWISARQVSGVLVQFCSQTVALYDAGVEKYCGSKVEHYQAGYDPVQQRAAAVTWVGQGGILVTHSALFTGMEAATVILVTHKLGDGNNVRSELSRAVARLVVVTDSTFAKQDKIKEHFNVVHVAGDDSG